MACRSLILALAVVPLLAACGVTERFIGGPDQPGPQAPVVVVETTPEGLTVLARSPQQPLLLESVALDSAGRLLVSSIHQAGV